MISIVLGIFGILVVMFLFGGCSFWWADPTYYKYKELADKYGGYYVFDKKLADEMKQREKERGEFKKKVRDMSATDEEFRINSKKYDVDKELPQTLSNGCEYYLKGMSKQELEENDWSPYYDKIKEYVGAENYGMFLKTTESYYKCNEKTYPLIVTLIISYGFTEYGLFGDEGRGFGIGKYRVRYIDNPYILYLIDDKFVKTDKNYYEEYVKWSNMQTYIKRDNNDK